MNIVGLAKSKRLNYVFGDYATIASLVKFSAMNKEIIILSMLISGEKLRGITNKSIIFCEDYNRANRLFKNLLIELKELNLKFIANNRELSIKVG